MHEELLHYIWQYKYLLNHKLFTTKGEPVQVIMPGQLNRDAGPDFFNARICLNNTLWAGNIEIHLKSSDWKKHKHQHDRAYDNVILHVVLHHDEPIFNRDQQEIPTLELKTLLPPKMMKKYSYLKESQNEIPCESIFRLPEPFITENWFERLSVERLEQKYEHIQKLLLETNNNWEEVFYHLLAKYFGQKTNELPFELLAKQLPFLILNRNKNNLLQTQALVLGIAGMLQPKFEDEYLNTLQKEFNFLKNKYQLKPIEKMVWKYGRTRPANFPGIRLLQFAQIIHQSSNLWSQILKANSLEEVSTLFEIKSMQLIRMGVLNGKSDSRQLSTFQTGPDFVNTILINVVIPLLFAYGKWDQNERCITQSLHWLNQLKPEGNRITKKWEKNGIKPKNAKQSQALIALNNYYCIRHQCLRCAFGMNILNPENE